MTIIFFFFAVVAGDAFVRILNRLTASVKDRNSAATYPPTVVWQVFLLMVVIEIWVATARDQEHFTSVAVGSLILFLALPIGVVVLAELLNVDDGEDPVADFNRQRRLFFCILCALPVLSIIRQIFGNDLEFGLDFFFQIALMAGALLGLFVRRGKPDLILAILMTTVVIAYTFIVYGTISR